MTVTDLYGCDVDDDIYVQVRELPEVTINSPVICFGDPATLVANPTSYQTYSWSHGVFGYSTTVTPMETSTYYVTVTDNLGCSESFSTNVTVNPVPSFTIADENVCFGESVTITASGSFPQYIWSTGENGSSITVVANETSTYSCTATNTYGCSSTEEMTLTVLQPAPLIMENIEACQGDIVTLTAPPGFSYYRWSNGVEYRTTEVVADQTRNYTLEVIDINGCENSATITVFANPYPIVEISDIEMNQGEIRVVHAPSGYHEYLWSTGHIDDFIEISPVEDSEYWIRVTTINNCSSSDTFLVYVYPLPVIQMEDTVMCYGETIRLEAPEGYVNYVWSAGEQTWEGRIIQVSPETTTVFYLEVTNEHGGTGGTDFIVTVNELPEINCNDTLICIGDQVTLVTLEGYADYLWSTGDTGNSITVSPQVTTVYTILVTGENGCTNQQEVNVFVDNPFTEFTASMTDIRPGDPVQFVVNSVNPVHSYFWDFGDGSDGRGANLIHYYYTEGTFDVSLSVTSENQCSSVNLKEDLINVNHNNSGLSTNQTELSRGIFLYPNPFRDEILIDSKDCHELEFIKLALFTVTGNMVMDRAIVTQDIIPIDLSKLHPGPYIIRLTFKNYTFSQKLIKVE